MGSSNTALLLIEGAIRLIKGINYNPSPADLGAGFTGLNDLIASWSSDEIMVPAVISENFPLVAAQGSYTIGSGGDFNTVRPTKIKAGVFIRDSNGSDHPVYIITREQYLANTLKNVGGRPSRLYYKPEYPLGIIYFNMVPTSTESIYFDSLKPITEITDVSVTLALPPNYKRALKYNLALEIAPEFDDIKIPELTVTIAKESKEALERTNTLSMEESTFDNILTPGNVLTKGSFDAG
jgi:hypothetical protein